jgi:hypothetical protein
MELKKYYDEPDEPYGVISVSVFRMRKKYRSTKIYYNGLKTMAQEIQHYFPGFYLRVYFDRSIIKESHKDEEINKEIRELWKPLIKHFKTLEYVQLVKYKIPELLEKDPLYHQGLMGTLIRFLPLFNYASNNTNFVIISDIDADDGKSILKSKSSIYKLFLESDSQFHFKTRDCYETADRFILVEKAIDLKYVPKIKYRMIASAIMSKIQFPKEIFEDFFSCLKDIHKENCKYVDIFTTIQNDSLMNQKSVQDVGERLNLPYGIDEFFLNINLLKYIEAHKIPFSYTIFSKGYTTAFYSVYLKKNQYKNADQNTINLFKKIIGKYYQNNKSFIDNYNFFDRAIYHGTNNSKKQEISKYIHHNIITAFTDLRRDNSYEKYGFDKSMVDCILRTTGKFPKLLIMHKYD